MQGTTTRDGAGRVAQRSQQAEQRAASARRDRAAYRDSPELRAICKAFDCDVRRAKRILKAARKAL